MFRSTMFCTAVALLAATACHSATSADDRPSNTAAAATERRSADSDTHTARSAPDVSNDMSDGNFDIVARSRDGFPYAQPYTRDNCPMALPEVTVTTLPAKGGVKLAFRTNGAVDARLMERVRSLAGRYDQLYATRDVEHVTEVKAREDGADLVVYPPERNADRVIDKVRVDARAMRESRACPMYYQL